MAIQITKNAWKKISEICLKTNNSTFLFSVSPGGCNGLNYILNPISFNEVNSLIEPYIKSKKSKKSNITILNDDENENKVIIDPLAEMFLLGTKVDYQEQDYLNNIFESKFIFKIDKKYASSCGCGTSFMPKKFDKN